MTQAQTQANDLSLLGNFSMEDLADIPEFRTFPAGDHVVNTTFEVKKSKKLAPMVVVTFKAIETAELVNEADTPLREGETNKFYCMLNSEYGQADLRKIIGPIATATGTSNLADIISAVNEEGGVNLLITTYQREDKKEPGKMDLKIRAVSMA